MDHPRALGLQHQSEAARQAAWHAADVSKACESRPGAGFQGLVSKDLLIVMGPNFSYNPVKLMKVKLLRSPQVNPSPVFVSANSINWALSEMSMTV